MEQIKLTDSHRFWLQTTLQNGIQVSMQMSRLDAPEQTPFVHKYSAIQLLKQLNQYEHQYQFIVDCILGDLYNDVQQTHDSVTSYHRALKSTFNLTPQQSHSFTQYLIVIYNMLGLSYVNRQDFEQGLGCLAKSCQIYEAYREVPGENVYHNRSFQSKGRSFRFFYQGGIDHDQVEDSHTLTLFYLAQAFTKLQLRERAAQYCGLTLQRQHQNDKYELTQFVNNLIGLAEYYQGTKHFAQAQYIYMLGLKVIPQGQRKQLRGTLHMGIGTMLCDMLELACHRLENNDVKETDNELVSKQLLLFKNFSQPFPKIILPHDAQTCKSLFRQSNTQLKRASQIYILDGYVTQHIDILFTQSRLYKSLTIIENSVERKISMLQKRRDMLEPLIKELNPKAYPATWQRILVQVSQIYNDHFNLRVANLTDGKGMPSEEKINMSCQLGKKNISYYKQIIKVLQQEKEAEKNQQYFRSIINSKINVAKATSKLLSTDRQQRVEYLKQSLGLYNAIIQYISKGIPQNLRSCFKKELQLTREMIAMMPSKIDRINYGKMHYIE